jgi:hypothetical protein
VICNFAENTWITILAVGGLIVSLAAGGSVWWSRAQHSGTDGAMVLSVNREPAAMPENAETQDLTPKRRAA